MKLSGKQGPRRRCWVRAASRPRACSLREGARVIANDLRTRERARRAARAAEARRARSSSWARTTARSSRRWTSSCSRRACRRCRRSMPRDASRRPGDRRDRAGVVVRRRAPWSASPAPTARARSPRWSARCASAAGGPRSSAATSATPLVDAVGTPPRSGRLRRGRAVELPARARASASRVHVAVLLNVTDDHLDRYPTLRRRTPQPRRASSAASARATPRSCRRATRSARRLAARRGATLHTFGGADGEVRVEDGVDRRPRHGRAFRCAELRIRGRHNHEQRAAPRRWPRGSRASRPSRSTRCCERSRACRTAWCTCATLDGVDYYDDSQGDQRRRDGRGARRSRSPSGARRADRRRQRQGRRLRAAGASACAARGARRRADRRGRAARFASALARRRRSGRARCDAWTTAVRARARSRSPATRCCSRRRARASTCSARTRTAATCSSGAVRELPEGRVDDGLSDD